MVRNRYRQGMKYNRGFVSSMSPNALLGPSPSMPRLRSVGSAGNCRLWSKAATKSGLRRPCGESR